MSRSQKFFKNSHKYVFEFADDQKDLQTIPTEGILLEHGKQQFDRASLAVKDASKPDAKPITQGLIGVTWMGINKNGRPTFFMDVFITYNGYEKDPKTGLIYKLIEKKQGDQKDAKKEQKPCKLVDRHQTPYEADEIILTKHQLGANSGTAHETAIEKLENRIQLLLEKIYKLKSSNDDKLDDNEAKALNALKEELAIYEGIYEIDSGKKVRIIKEKCFGFGVFKGDNQSLLYQFRNKSANLNSQSVRYSKEFKYINYFKIPRPEERDPFEQIFYITRSLPVQLTKIICDAFIRELREYYKKSYGLEFKDSVTDKKPQDNEKYEIEYFQIFDKPEKKNEFLLNTFFYFITEQRGEDKEIDELIGVIKENAKNLNKRGIDYFNKSIGEVTDPYGTYKGKSVFALCLEKDQLKKAAILFTTCTTEDDKMNFESFLAYYKTKDHASLITEAVKNRDIKLIVNLIELMRSYLNYNDDYILKILCLEDDNKKTAISIAVEMNNEEIINILEKNNVKKTPYEELLFEMNNIAKNPHIEKKLAQITKELKESKKEELPEASNKNVEKTDSDKMDYPLTQDSLNRLLYYAVKNNQLNFVKILLGKGAENTLHPEEKLTPLSKAISDKRTDIAEILIEKYKHQLNDDDISSLVHLAVKNDEEKIVEKLLNINRKTMIDIYKDDKQESVYSMAQKNQSEIKQLILTQHSENCYLALIALKDAIEKFDWKIPPDQYSRKITIGKKEINISGTVYDHWKKIASLKAPSDNKDILKCVRTYDEIMQASLSMKERMKEKDSKNKPSISSLPKKKESIAYIKNLAENMENPVKLIKVLNSKSLFTPASHDDNVASSIIIEPSSPRSGMFSPTSPRSRIFSPTAPSSPPGSAAPQYRDAFVFENKPRIDEIKSNMLVMVKEDKNLTAYWIDNQQKLVSRSFPLEEVTNITQQLPKFGSFSNNLELINNIILKYSCTASTVQRLGRPGV